MPCSASRFGRFLRGSQDIGSQRLADRKTDPVTALSSRLVVTPCNRPEPAGIRQDQRGQVWPSLFARTSAARTREISNRCVSLVSINPVGRLNSGYGYSKPASKEIGNHLFLQNQRIDPMSLDHLHKSYDCMLNDGLKISGYDKNYFAQGRIHTLKQSLIKGKIESILDFGCGEGDSTPILREYFPEAHLIGTDISDDFLHHATLKYATNDSQLHFIKPERLQNSSFDLCYCNGVFHHIHPDLRAETLERIHQYLKLGGKFALFENNPFNPGVHIIMKRIEFDRDSVLLTMRETGRMIRKAGFRHVRKPISLFFFPAFLKALRPIEKHLSRLPFGAQFCILATK